MKRIILAAVAISMLASPMAQAHDYRREPQRIERSHGPSYDRHRHNYQKPHAQRHHWSKGHRMSDWRRQKAVREYHRHGLRRPGHGQQWVRVDNDYLLITMATGIIAGIVAAR